MRAHGPEFPAMIEVPPHPADPVSCLECDWQGLLADCVEVDDLDYCPRCTSLIDMSCEPIYVEAVDPNAVTR